MRHRVRRGASDPVSTSTRPERALQARRVSLCRTFDRFLPIQSSMSDMKANKKAQLRLSPFPPRRRPSDGPPKGGRTVELSLDGFKPALLQAANPPFGIIPHATEPDKRRSDGRAGREDAVQQRLDRDGQGRKPGGLVPRAMSRWIVLVDPEKPCEVGVSPAVPERPDVQEKEVDGEGHVGFVGARQMEFETLQGAAFETAQPAGALPSEEEGIGGGGDAAVGNACI